MRNGIRAALLSAFIFALGCCFSLAQDSPPSRLIPISAADIGTKYVVIGPLGKPLGELMNVEAQALYPQKGDSCLLRIFSVDGRRLKEPIDMHFEFLGANIRRLEVGHRCHLRLFQDAGFHGIPHEVMKEIMPIQSAGHHFRTKAMVIKSFSPTAAEQEWSMPKTPNGQPIGCGESLR